MTLAFVYGFFEVRFFSGHFEDHYKLRGGVYFIDEMPFTASGQINRQLIKEIVTELFAERSN